MNFDVNQANNAVVRELYEQVESSRVSFLRCSRQGRTALAEGFRQQLVDMQVKLYLILHDTPISEDELTDLRHSYWMAAQPENHPSQPKCWVCSSNLYKRAHKACPECHWLVCVCGACQCPDYSLGPRAYAPECKLQIQRLGLLQYQYLIQMRLQ